MTVCCCTRLSRCRSFTIKEPMDIVWFVQIQTILTGDSIVKGCYLEVLSQLISECSLCLSVLICVDWKISLVCHETRLTPIYPYQTSPLLFDSKVSALCFVTLSSLFVLSVITSREGKELPYLSYTLFLRLVIGHRLSSVVWWMGSCQAKITRNLGLLVKALIWYCC